VNLTTTDIERVVREVLAELGKPVGQVVNLSRENGRLDNPSQVNRQVSGQVGDNTGQVDNPSCEGNLVLAASVVSINDVHGRLESVRRVVVRRRAVVTPAVRDELLRRGIALEYDDSDVKASPAVRLVMIATGTGFDPAPLAAALEREGYCVERSASDCLIAAVDALANEITRPDKLGVLLTSHAAAGLCLANRLIGVRAIIGTNAAETARSAAAVGANILVANPRRDGFFQLKQCVAEFARGGRRPCPTVFDKRLD